MLDPNLRNLYTDALTPPPGMVFDEGVTTTYTLDLTTLLTMPLQLILRRVENSDELLRDPVALLQALQQTQLPQLPPQPSSPQLSSVHSLLSSQLTGVPLQAVF